MNSLPAVRLYIHKPLPESPLCSKSESRGLMQVSCSYTLWKNELNVTESLPDPVLYGHLHSQELCWLVSISSYWFYLCDVSQLKNSTTWAIRLKFFLSSRSVLPYWRNIVRFILEGLVRGINTYVKSLITSANWCPNRYCGMVWLARLACNRPKVPNSRPTLWYQFLSKKMLWSKTTTYIPSLCCTLLVSSLPPLLVSSRLNMQ